ncbi:MAG: hypothetical protein A2735_02450 [Candidatus Yanofskybacteria bacterium RIFCSPHIGHO2_01_FULL_41_21]|uniref:Peptidase M50 domain-containing protein n=2 Tax=Candidatus Yanofskyibacteriota TaxID=1752733 RepID=A0A0G0WLU5_9BACT|nr:MAG: hypothetical protein UU70_C0011G0006 [Candidatus Yanofskybacteria bacterium GW2011_GWA1_41_6]OGM98004.1 MAG: hypothetical protein A2735_02450 [Candidatus Yanofskybacteria bacterium RIFCSPHIGHO2_01_FULL_41_21]
MILLPIFQIVAFVYSVVLHEISHGLMAQSLGDDTAKNSGRLTLNPLPHIDMFGSIILPLLTYLGAGFMFGYAKPVPYDVRNLRDQKYGPTKVALVGPATNILIALCFGLILRLLSDSIASVAIAQLFGYIVWINLTLAIFNLCPVPPLDGHWPLITLLPQKFDEAKRFILRYSLFLMVIFIFIIFPTIYSYTVPPLFKLIVGYYP